MNAQKLKRLYNDGGGKFFDRSHTKALKARVESVATSRRTPDTYYFVESRQGPYDPARYYRVFVMYRLSPARAWVIDSYPIHNTFPTLDAAKACMIQLAKGE